MEDTERERAGLYILGIHIIYIIHGGLSVIVRIFVEVFLNAKIVQIESRISSLLEYYAEMQPILCKDTSF